MNVILLGSGSVATHLGQALNAVGHNIIQVWSRNENHAAILANKLSAESISAISSLITTADIYIIAVKDDAILDVVKALPRLNGLVVHTSGSTDMLVLEGTSSEIGVLYPIQTFSKSKKVNFEQVPIAIESNTNNGLDLLRVISESVTQKVIQMNSVQRITLHMAAVFACNFTNHLYVIAQDILKQQHLDFDLLRPLIAETAVKVKENDPIEVQTGPAVRGDNNIIKKHIELLKNNPEYLELYHLFSQGIINASYKK